MSLRCGLVGLPNVGKSTRFGAHYLVADWDVVHSRVGV
jgi:ribosome-binding ATPase YchF (GTP1/OBG family)